VGGTGRDTLSIAGLPADEIVALLGDSRVPFAEVSAHRATLEEVYLELTRDSAEFRATTAGGEPGALCPGAGTKEAAR
jgi:ABC-2 type transport system ATP-binding protein